PAALRRGRAGGFRRSAKSLRKARRQCEERAFGRAHDLEREGPPDQRVIVDDRRNHSGADQRGFSAARAAVNENQVSGAHHPDHFDGDVLAPEEDACFAGFEGPQARIGPARPRRRRRRLGSHRLSAFSASSGHASCRASTAGRSNKRSSFGSASPTKSTSTHGTRWLAVCWSTRRSNWLLTTSRSSGSAGLLRRSTRPLQSTSARWRRSRKVLIIDKLSGIASKRSGVTNATSCSMVRARLQLSESL